MRWGGGEGVGWRVQNQVLRALRGQREPCTHTEEQHPRDWCPPGRALQAERLRRDSPVRRVPGPPAQHRRPLGWEPLVAPLHVPAPRSPVSHLCPLFPGEVDGNVSESGSGLETIIDSVDNSLLRENSQRGLRSASRGEQPGPCGLCGAGTKRSAPRPARRVPAPEPLWRSCPRCDLTRP